MDFHPGVNYAWQYYQTTKSAIASKQFCHSSVYKKTLSHFKSNGFFLLFRVNSGSTA